MDSLRHPTQAVTSTRGEAQLVARSAGMQGLQTKNAAELSHKSSSIEDLIVSHG